jgi:hypothetical protein
MKGFPLTLLHKDLEVEMTVNWFGDQHSLAQEQIDRISACGRKQSRLWESAQGDKWSFCLTAGKIGPRIRREHEQETAPEPYIGL